MSDDEIHSHLTNDAYLAMDDAFCARMRKAIATGRESSPIGVITTPGTQNPRYVSEVAARYHRPRDER